MTSGTSKSSRRSVISPAISTPIARSDGSALGAQRAAPFPLLARRDDEEPFRAPEGEVSAAQFLGAAHRLAAELPAGAHVLNLCQGRYAFTLAFAASLLRGQVSLLTSDRSAGRIAELALLTLDLCGHG